MCMHTNITQNNAKTKTTNSLDTVQVSVCFILLLFSVLCPACISSFPALKCVTFNWVTLYEVKLRHGNTKAP